MTRWTMFRIVLAARWNLPTRPARVMFVLGALVALPFVKIES